MGEVPAEDIQNDSEYLAQVSIGQPAQTLTLNFDTGSSDLWVWSTSLPKNTRDKGVQSGHKLFDPTKSSTFKNSDGCSWTIQYGDGSTASGKVGADTVKLGGLSVENQAVEIADTLSSSFESCQGDGLLGLAYVSPLQKSLFRYNGRISLSSV